MTLTLIYFRFGSGSRLLKKKSHHYIIPPSSDDDPNWIPIEINEYDKYIFYKQNSEKIIIEEVAKIIRNEFPQIDIDVTSNNEWIQLNVIHSNFADFHKLISLCSFTNGENVIGYCKHKTTKSEDYIVKLDIDAENEHLIGSFQTNQNFGIYLPKSDNDPKGNISKSHVKEIDFQYEINQIPSFT